jgi:D-arabinose 5-phosphate isomerase GutQ
MAILRNPKLNMWLFAMVLLMGTGITAFGVGPSDIEKLIGKRVSTVDIVVEGAPSSETREMRDVITVRPDQSCCVVQIHD